MFFQVGDIYYVAGQIPLIPGTMQILNKPILLQCKLVLRHVQRILEAMDANLNFNNVLQVICYVTSPEIAFDIPSLWSYVTQSTNATLATFVVKGLPRNAQMEWEVVACGSQNARGKFQTNSQI